MLIHIIKKELLNNLLTARVLVCYTAIFILVFTGVLIRGLQFNREMRFYEDQKAAEQARVIALEEDAELASDRYLWAFNMQVRPRPLSLFCEGFHKQITEPFRVNPQAMVYDTFVLASPLSQAFTLYNVVFIISVAISLLCVFIGFDSFSSEREDGTLRLVLSNPVSKAVFILAKFAGGYLSVLWPVVASLLFSLVFSMLVLRITFGASDFLRFTLLAAVIAGYLAVWFFISMICSIAAGASNRALLYAVLVWIFFAVAIPYGAHEASQRLEPVLDMADVYKNRETVQQDATRKRNRLVGRLRRERSPDYKLREWRAYYDYFTEIHNAMVRMGQEWERGIRRQMEKGMAYSRISPTAQFIHTAAGVAGTGFYEYWKSQDWKTGLYLRNKASFETERNHRRDLYRGTSVSEREEIVAQPKANFDRDILPDRNFPEMRVTESLQKTAFDALLLILETVLLFVTAFYAFIRKDVL